MENITLVDQMVANASPSWTIAKQKHLHLVNIFASLNYISFAPVLFPINALYHGKLIFKISHGLNASE